MKKIKLIVLFFFLVPLIGLSQNHKIDSLRNKLLTAKKEDTTKVNLLQSLSNSLFASAPEEGYNCSKQALALSQKLNYTKGVIRAYQNIAGYYYRKGDLKSALEYSNKAVPLIEQTNDKHALAISYTHLSSITMEQTNYNTALDYSNKALQLAQELNDSGLITKIIGNRGIIYMYVSDYPRALSYFLQTLKMCLAKKDTASLAGAYYDLGYIYRLEHSNNPNDKADNEKANNYFSLALKTSQSVDNRFLIAGALQQLGEICQENKEWKKALGYFQQSITVDQAIGDSMNISVTMRDMALIYSENGQFDKAMQSANIALSIAQKNNIKLDIGNSYQCMGEIYMKKNDYPNAINYLQKSTAIADAAGQKNNQSILYRDMAKCYEALNDYKTAYIYSNKYSVVKDSILTKDAAEKTTEMEALYNSEKSEQQIALLTKNSEIQKLQIKKQSLLQKSLIAGILLMGLLFFFVYRSYHTRQLLKLQTLRNKIASDLHDDIGSTLSSISIFSLMAREGSKEVIPMLDQIGEYSRNMLESMADIVWNINPTNDNFEKILLRMKSLAFEMLGAKNIDFEFNTDETLTNFKLSMELRKNLYLIFKEATNNLVKYSQADSAIFSITHSKNNLTMLIRDNGKGFDINRESQGNGLRNMKNRAEEIGAKFLIESEPGKGTTIQLLIKAA